MVHIFLTVAFRDRRTFSRRSRNLLLKRSKASLSGEGFGPLEEVPAPRPDGFPVSLDVHSANAYTKVIGFSFIRRFDSVHENMAPSDTIAVIFHTSPTPF